MLKYGFSSGETRIDENGGMGSEDSSPPPGRRRLGGGVKYDDEPAAAADAVDVAVAAAPLPGHSPRIA